MRNEKPVLSQHAANAKMVDPFGREVSYLRVSVTDRCDFRCTYCMSENMTFLPKKDLLSLEELERLCQAFIVKGVRKLRLTGGEPLVRKNIMSLIEALGREVSCGNLEELTLTTNGSQLENFAQGLSDNGVRRINVSLDTLNPQKFKEITRWGELAKVQRGIEAAKKAGLRVKINTVALKGFNDTEALDLINFAHSSDMDITFIETMPMGEIEEDRTDRYLPISQLRSELEQTITLTPLQYATGGPARYFKVEQTGGRLGFITPLTHNFCEGCNRVRLTCTGTLYLCLGQDDAADLRTVLRSSPDNEPLYEAIDEAITRKPKGHDFIIDRKQARPAVRRHMSVTGG
jgi:cyclic pyranopterin phosphate synthase